MFDLVILEVIKEEVWVATLIWESRCAAPEEMLVEHQEENRS